jgi:hypothetical protein
LRDDRAGLARANRNWLATKWRQSNKQLGALGFGDVRSVTGLCRAALVAAAVATPVLLASRAPAGWWTRAPVDFEECAEQAATAASQEDRTAALAACNAKFAGRRKPGGGYTYYDFLQDRSFDIAGPNPTPDEQKYIDRQYTVYLERQRQSRIKDAIAAKQQQQEEQQHQLQQASLRTESERVPIPQARPNRLIAGQGAANDNRSHGPANDCGEHSFSCEWPRLSETINGLKKLFGASPGKGKKG